MSRGPGRIQRRVLEALTDFDAYVDTLTLAAKVYFAEPKPLYGKPEFKVVDIADDKVSIVRRALNRLHRQGKIFKLDGRPDHRSWWSHTPRPMGGAEIWNEGGVKFAINFNDRVDTRDSTFAAKVWRNSQAQRLARFKYNWPPLDIDMARRVEALGKSDRKD